MKTLVLSLAGPVLGSLDTPVSKVIELLSGMVVKSKDQKKAEEVEYSAYRRWCLDTQQETQQQITDGNEKIEMLNADIQKSQATADELARHVAAHDGDIAVWTGDVKAANKVRDIEKADFMDSAKNYDESIDALGRAIMVLQQQSFSREQASGALIQVRALVTAPQKRVIDSFLAQSGEDIADSLEPSGYDFQSKGVVDMLKKLKDKFRDESEALHRTETESKHAHTLLLADLQAQMKEATRQRTEKSEARATALQNGAAAKSDLADATATRDEDQTFLQATTAACTQKASDFDSRSTLRGEEIAAMEKAIEILSSDDVKGNAEKHLPTMVQRSLVQLRATTGLLLQKIVNDSNESNEQARVASYLKIKGAKLHSRVLAAMALRVEQDPFVKVKKMIQDLVVRLMEEAANEASEKAWCDGELKSNEATRKEKTSRVEKLHSEVDLLTATISKLGEDITELTAAVAQIDKDVAEATKNRQAEKQTNLITIQDAKDAQVAVSQALEVLRNFYASAGEATALLQAPEPRERAAPPPVFDRAYKGLQAENGGVVGMIEVIQSDFARLESETTASETQAQKEYDEFTQDAAVNKAQKEKDIEHKRMKKQNTEQQLQETRGDLEGTQQELDAALNEYDKLKQSCIDTGLDYSERVERRENEIKSLKEALSILSGEDDNAA